MVDSRADGLRASMRWLLSFVIACSAPRAAQPARDDGVARVNGQTIAASEVEALVRATGVTPREALHDLVSERLLASHAEPYAARVERGVQRVLVQRLLAIEVGEGDPELQRAKLEKLLARLRAETPVQYQEEAIAREFGGRALP
jgi:hypothetical protein